MSDSFSVLYRKYTESEVKFYESDFSKGTNVKEVEAKQ